MSETEKNKLLTQFADAWVYEAVAWYADDKQTGGESIGGGSGLIVVNAHVAFAVSSP
jgi:hypothetical protein